jgi:hypothetical protein
MPDYFRTDVSAQYMLNKPEKNFKHYLTISIYNLTAHQNPALIYFNKIIDENGKFVVPYDYASDNQLNPSQMILLGFIPSVKYNFHFNYLYEKNTPVITSDMHHLGTIFFM